VVLIFLTKFLLNKLGPEGFGIFQYVITLQGSLMFLDLGVGATLNRFSAHLLAVKDYKRLNSTASFSTLIFLGSGGLGAAIVIGLGCILPSLVVGATPELYSSGFFLMCCIGGVLILRFLGYTAQGLLFGSQRYDLVNAVQAGTTILRAVLVVIMFVIVPTSGLATIGLCYILGTVIETLLMWLFAKLTIPALRLNILSINKGIAKEVMSFSVFVLITAVTSMLIMNSPVFLTGRLYGPEYVAFISLPLLIVSQLQRLSAGFAYVLIPVASKYGALGKEGRLQELTTVGTKLCATMCIPTAVVAVIFGQPLLEWFKEGFGWTWGLLAIIMLPELIATSQRVSYSVLMGAGSVKWIAYGGIIVALAIMFMSWLFAVHFDMKLYGIVLGVAIPRVLFNAIVQPMYACRQIGLKWLSYMGKSYGRVILGTVPTAAAAFVLVRYLYPGNLLMIISDGLVCMVIFAVTVLLYILTRDERNIVFGLFKLKKSSGKPVIESPMV
jgi:O-antigen/teichoic acid export membrane protein